MICHKKLELERNHKQTAYFASNTFSQQFIQSGNMSRLIFHQQNLSLKPCLHIVLTVTRMICHKKLELERNHKQTAYFASNTFSQQFIQSGNMSRLIFHQQNLSLKPCLHIVLTVTSRLIFSNMFLKLPRYSLI